jgi:hypothetical protein
VIDKLTYYKPEFFSIKELVDKKTYNRFGSNALRFLDPRILWTADMLREMYGSIIINNWSIWDGGNLDSCGFRRPNDKDGAEFSAHKRGQALDLHFQEADNDTVREIILEHPNYEAYQYITAIEMEVSWLHISCENVKRIKRIYPK